MHARAFAYIILYYSLVFRGTINPGRYVKKRTRGFLLLLLSCIITYILHISFVVARGPMTRDAYTYIKHCTVYALCTIYESRAAHTIVQIRSRGMNKRYSMVRCAHCSHNTPEHCNWFAYRVGRAAIHVYTLHGEWGRKKAKLYLFTKSTRP